MLEGVLGPMGVPGLGMALGALAYAIEPQIPKIKEWADAWEMGTKKLDEATQAIRRFDNAQSESRQKRALGKIDSQITALEDKEDEQGWLSIPDQQTLRKLRERSKSAHDDFDLAAGSAARTQRDFDARDQAEVNAIDEEEAERVGNKQARFARAHDLNESEKAAAKAKAQKDRETERAVADGQRFAEQAAREEARAKAQKDREAAKAVRDAERDAERMARENTPERAKQAAIAGEIANQGGANADPDFVRQVASQASRNVTMGAQLSEAVYLAVQQVQAKIAADFQRGMARMQVNTESYYGP